MFLNMFIQTCEPFTNKIGLNDSSGFFHVISEIPVEPMKGGKELEKFLNFEGSFLFENDVLYYIYNINRITSIP